MKWFSKVYFNSQVNQRGFTIVELMIAVVTAAIVLSAITLSLRSGLFSSVGIQSKITTQQDVRAAIETMALEIGMASYNPRFEPQIWADLLSTTGLNCSVSTAAPTNPLKKGIVEATANSLTIEADLNADGIIGAGGQQNEVIRYVYVTAGGEQYISRCTCCTSGSTGGGGQPFLGAPTGQQRTVKVINNQVGIPVFRYFYGNGVEFTPNAALTNCINQGNNLNAHICNIRRIDITLVVESDTIDPMTRQYPRLIYSTSVIPKNHPINP
ncbi:MAG: prepilin-type N-terminal cleavage/methylation domain-containing protein [Thermodesulfovibrionales bacterium]|nr:prepilin-type N-terminal cleavage/methylation domain-containing protein [Thermodesulfovibrionales bacterium]